MISLVVGVFRSRKLGGIASEVTEAGSSAVHVALDPLVEQDLVGLDVVVVVQVGPVVVVAGDVGVVLAQ